MGDRRARSAFRNRPARSAETGREQRRAVKDKPCPCVKLADIENDASFGVGAASHRGWPGCGWAVTVSGMPFKHNAARRHRIPKTRYRVQNWPVYEAGLKRRGDLTDNAADDAGQVPALLGQIEG